MSNELALTPMESEVYSYEQGFNQVNAYNTNFKKEAGFALQLLKANDFLKNTASANPDSLRNAIVNLAAIGISLNPATKEAYLVPRKNQVCLDISAIGLIKLATDSGSIDWVQAKVVYAKDKFTDNGPGQAPTHQFEAFSERGQVIGVYAVAKTKSGDYLSDSMSIKECHDIRDRSEAWKAFSSGKVKQCPWASDEGEMMKKTILKRASKLWPKSERMDSAVEVINQHEGIDFNAPKAPHVDQSAYSSETPNEKIFANLRAVLAAKGKTEEALLSYLTVQFKGEVFEKIEDLNSAQVEYSYRMLGGKK